MHPVSSRRLDAGGVAWPGAALVLGSIVLQLPLALLLGHATDTRIFMTSGYLVGTGQNPYQVFDATSVFHQPGFEAVPAIGYPPPLPLLFGLIYRLTYALLPDLLVYNLGLKLPVIAANVLLGILTARILRSRRPGDRGRDGNAGRAALAAVLFNPLVLYTTSAWGQYDTVAALLALWALCLLADGADARAGIALGLSVCVKPLAFALAPLGLLFALKRSTRAGVRFSGTLLLTGGIVAVGPFLVFGWSPRLILENWDAHFIVAGALSPLSFWELLGQGYALPGALQLLGFLWLPALVLGFVLLRPGSGGLFELLRDAAAILLVFMLTRAWLSEPNLCLLVPILAALWLSGTITATRYRAFWIIPLIFTVLNGTLPQLLFLVYPSAQTAAAGFDERFRVIRLLARSVTVIPWQVLGWTTVALLARRAPMRARPLETPAW